MKLTVGDIRRAIADLPDEYPVYVFHTDDTEDDVVVDGFRGVMEGPEDEGCFLINAHVHYEDAELCEDCDEELSDCTCEDSEDNSVISRFGTYAEDIIDPDFYDRLGSQ